MRAMNIQTIWRKKRWATLYRLVGMSKCTVHHVHIIRVLRQKEMILKVPRCFGSSIHVIEWSLGAMLLLVGLSIYVVDQ